MEIKIIETSDMHGYVLPTNYAERNLDLGFSTAKAATIIKKIKKEAKGPVVQIENGDFIQGSPLSYYVRKQGHHIANDLTKVLNYLEYDLGFFYLLLIGISLISVVSMYFAKFKIKEILSKIE